MTTLKLPAAGTTCDPDPKIGKPDWWDGLPVPDGFSQPVSLPALASAIGAELAFGEMRTTTMSAQDAVAAYTAAMTGADFQQFDPASPVPYEDSAEGVYADISGHAVGVLALGPKAFNDETLQSARLEVPPNTTVVYVFAVPV